MTQYSKSRACGPWFNEQAGQFKWDELQASDALLLGRKTYEGFDAAWPSFPDEVGFADKMNSMPKYVVSATLDTVDWPGSVLVTGGGQLFADLVEANLIDVYRFMLHPVILGKGDLLFAKPVTQRALTLAGTKTFDSGIIILEYTPAEPS